ncbi:hypothetical protein Taro_019743 [Colocasia esculenta]|uniref:GDSL esterase/lipase APG n=1 Tax=Colocasia esculenta TaxID=4460 RepID=A0A843V028_COLES|nr:hypothetical protein [Colocasia esculenta]
MGLGGGEGLKGARVVLVAVLFSAVFTGGNAQGLVPAIITFGDSAVDVGNNDYLPTIFRADFPPYGRDFTNHQPTGRFCNGKLATDITAETLGFTKFPPAYLSPEASGSNLLLGANFASAASGYYDHTAIAYLLHGRFRGVLTRSDHALFKRTGSNMVDHISGHVTRLYDDKLAIERHAIPLPQQLEYYKEYQSKLAQVAGSKKASSIISEALYILSAGSSDFVQNYYLNPWLNKVYSPDDFSSILIGIFSSFIKFLRAMQTGLPSLRGVPAPFSRRASIAVTLHWSGAGAACAGAGPMGLCGVLARTVARVMVGKELRGFKRQRMEEIKLEMDYHIWDLHGLGARKIGVTSLPPFGCLPATITLFGGGSNDCIQNLNNDAKNFNQKLTAEVNSLTKQYSDLKLVVFDIYKPFYDLVQSPSKYGFFEARKGCCGTGTVETSVLCNPKSPGTCKNATGYVFFDSVHPSQAANQVLADSLIIDGIGLIG